MKLERLLSNIKPADGNVLIVKYILFNCEWTQVNDGKFKIEDYGGFLTGSPSLPSWPQSKPLSPSCTPPCSVSPFQGPGLDSAITHILLSHYACPDFPVPFLLHISPTPQVWHKVGNKSMFAEQANSYIYLSYNDFYRHSKRSNWMVFLSQSA